VAKWLRELEQWELDELPVFPLPQTALLPGAKLPLHLFEPRYRLMIEDCIDRGPTAIAVAMLKPGWELQYEARPPVRRVAGVGRIVAHHALEDGTHDIVLEGIGRVELRELPVDGLPYRRARSKLLRDHGEPTASEFAGLIACASTVAISIQRTHPDFSLGVLPDDGPGRVVDVIADRFIADPVLRQRLVETLDVGERVELVTEAVGGLLAVSFASAPQRRQWVD